MTLTKFENLNQWYIGIRKEKRIEITEKISKAIVAPGHLLAQSVHSDSLYRYVAKFQRSNDDSIYIENDHSNVERANG